jgi:hypothetical protein
MTAPVASPAPVATAPSRVRGAGRDGNINAPYASTYDPVRYQRGTRGFAAFVTALNGFAVLGLGTLVLPASDLPDWAMAWAVGLSVAAGVLHLVAVVGLIRARRWARDLVGYLAAAGIGAAFFGLLMVARAQMPLGGPDMASTIGFFIWMIGTWAVAARFAFRAFAMPTSARPRLTVVSTRPVAEATADRAAVAPRPRLVVVGGAAR